MTGVEVDGQAAAGVLAHRLDALADRGRMTPCQTNPEAWFAEHRAQQAAAAEACTYCPLLEPCRTYADATDQVLHGVWGGVPRPVRPAAHPRPEES